MKRRFRKPESLLAELGITEPEEIDVEAIAYHCDATIIYGQVAGCEARILGTRERAIITVNENASPPRRRFSAAHELGHWMYDRGAASFWCTAQHFVQEWGRDNPERRANGYAADLLLPPAMFQPLAERQPMTFETASLLADRFATSLTATAIRLVELGSFPAMIICHSPHKRRWFVRGPDIPLHLWPRDSLTEDCVAHELLHDRIGTTPGPSDVAASAWFQSEGADRHVVYEDSRLINNENVLTILWWRDESQLLALEVNQE